MSTVGWGKKATPMMSGGVWLPDELKERKMSIWLDPTAPLTGRARLDSMRETPKFPDTKHTVKCVVHNITAYPVTERVGKSSYDPVQGSGKSVRCHHGLPLPPRPHARARVHMYMFAT